MTTKTTISKSEQDRRAEAVRQIRHSTEMEGGQTGPEARADQDAWVRGELSEAEWEARIRARQGLA